MYKYNTSCLVQLNLLLTLDGKKYSTLFFFFMRIYIVASFLNKFTVEHCTRKTDVWRHFSWAFE